jgi:hypothetical protein
MLPLEKSMTDCGGGGGGWMPGTPRRCRSGTLMAGAGAGARVGKDPVRPACEGITLVESNVGAAITESGVCALGVFGADALIGRGCEFSSRTYIISKHKIDFGETNVNLRSPSLSGSSGVSGVETPRATNTPPPGRDVSRLNSSPSMGLLIVAPGVGFSAGGSNGICGPCVAPNNNVMISAVYNNRGQLLNR